MMMTKNEMKRMAKAAAPIVRTTLKIAVPVAIVAGIATSCKVPKVVQAAPKRPVQEVTADIPNYEIKDAKPGGSKDADPLPLGISINNTGKPNNPDTYYYVPSAEEADALYGKKGTRKASATLEYSIKGIEGFGKTDNVNVGIVACRQILEFLNKAIMTDVSGGRVRLVEYKDKQLFVKEHAGYPTQKHYILNRNEHGLAAIYASLKDTSSFALWVIPERNRAYSIKVPFRIVPENDGAIRLDSNFFAYSSGGRRQIQVAIEQEKPVKPAVSVKDFQYMQKPTSAFGYSDGQNIVYTATNAVYISDEAANYAIGRGTFEKAQGDTAIALGSVGLAECKVSKALGNVPEAGLGVVVTRNGALATYYRLIKKEKDTTTTPSVVTLPLTRAEPGLKVLSNCNADNSREEVFNPVLGEGLGHFSFITSVPGQKDTMELRILREMDGDLIKVKMGLADVSRISHAAKGEDILITLWGADGLTQVGQVIISKGVPYERISDKNKLLQESNKASSYIRTGELGVPKVGEMPYVPKEHIMYLLADKYLPNGELRTSRSKFANRSI